jgi:hypothetical protein
VRLQVPVRGFDGLKLIVLGHVLCCVQVAHFVVYLVARCGGVLSLRRQNLGMFWAYLQTAPGAVLLVVWGSLYVVGWAVAACGRPHQPRTGQDPVAAKPRRREDR